MFDECKWGPDSCWCHAMPHFCSWHSWSKMNMPLSRCFHHIDWFQHFMSMVLCILGYDWSSYSDCIYGFIKTTINDLHMDYGDSLNNWALFLWQVIAVTTINFFKLIFSKCEKFTSSDCEDRREFRWFQFSRWYCFRYNGWCLSTLQMWKLNLCLSHVWILLLPPYLHSSIYTPIGVQVYIYTE
jgi:hypothetical protein